MLIRYGTDKNGDFIKKAVIYTQEEHLIPNNKIDPDALQIVNRLRDSGFTAYIVGGAVRDLIIGNTPKDFDIVTDATPSIVPKLFPTEPSQIERNVLTSKILVPKTT